jgi:hypothetical protein
VNTTYFPAFKMLRLSTREHPIKIFVKLLVSLYVPLLKRNHNREQTKHTLATPTLFRQCLPETFMTIWPSLSQTAHQHKGNILFYSRKNEKEESKMHVWCNYYSNSVQYMQGDQKTISLYSLIVIYHRM